MKIPKLFKKAAAFVMAAVTGLSHQKQLLPYGAVAPKTASALWQGFMLCMESLPYFYEKSVEPMA